MIKSVKAFSLSIFFLSITLSQELCPPALVDALFYNEKIELSNTTDPGIFKNDFEKKLFKKINELQKYFC